MPATVIGINVNAWNVPGIIASGRLPAYITDLGVSTVPGGTITPEDTAKLAQQKDVLGKKGVRFGRYLNLNHAAVQLDIQKVPHAALDANMLEEGMFWKEPETLREYPHDPNLKCVVREYNLVPSPARATLVRVLTTELNVTRDDLYFDGLCVPELVKSAAPYRLTDVVGYLQAIRAGIGIKRRRSYNFAGCLADWTASMVDAVASTKPYAITFEQVLHPSQFTPEKLTACVDNINHFKKAGVLPVLIGTSGERERAVCEWLADRYSVGISL